MLLSLPPYQFFTLCALSSMRCVKKAAAGLCWFRQESVVSMDLHRSISCGANPPCERNFTPFSDGQGIR